MRRSASCYAARRFVPQANQNYEVIASWNRRECMARVVRLVKDADGVGSAGQLGMAIRDDDPGAAAMAFIGAIPGEGFAVGPGNSGKLIGSRPWWTSPWGTMSAKVGCMRIHPPARRSSS
jgi:hypothetical protein